MANPQDHPHHHPDFDERIKMLEDQLKRLGKEVRDLKRKLDTHSHSHTH